MEIEIDEGREPETSSDARPQPEESAKPPKPEQTIPEGPVQQDTPPSPEEATEPKVPLAPEPTQPTEDAVPPEFTTLLYPQTVKDGERVTFHVTYHGVPSPNITWFHDGVEVPHSADFQITIDAEKGESYLIIVEVFPEDEGEYTCHAANFVGETMTTCRLTVQCKSAIG